MFIYNSISSHSMEETGNGSGSGGKESRREVGKAGPVGGRSPSVKTESFWLGQGLDTHPPAALTTSILAVGTACAPERPHAFPFQYSFSGYSCCVTKELAKRKISHP